MGKICDLDVEKYRCVSPDIRTSEVILTDERILHIKERHPGDYEDIEPFLGEAIVSPDYILEDAPNTGLILKRIKEEEMRFQLVLRLHTSSDLKGRKNSIISAWKISDSRWNNYVRNKKTLYKLE